MLSATEIAILDLERCWPVMKNKPAKSDVIREDVGLSRSRYYATLVALCDSEEAAAYDPLTVRRLRRRRDERRRAKFAQNPEARAIARLATSPQTTGIALDFDGTLAEIVPDPAAARPLPGAIDAVQTLARRFARVAVVSGRPVAFLAQRLEIDHRPGPIELYGQYGLEHRLIDGTLVEPLHRRRYVDAVNAALREARADAPLGVFVEAKGIALTLHWRRAPEAKDATLALARQVAEHHGLYARVGRMAVELVPDSAQNKGDAIRSVFADLTAGCVLGDDVGDIPAFRAARGLEQLRDFSAVLVVVVSREVPPELVEAADVRVDGPQGALGFLRGLASATD
jgi:trehalose 6-phosphate phosphatase